LRVPSPPARPVQIVVAFDFGLRRIGVACGDTITQTAAPATTLTNSASGPDWSGILQLLARLAPQQLVVGSPYNVDGSPGELAGAADAFAQELAVRSTLPVARVDERYSSLEAGAELKARRQSGLRTRRVQKQDVDSLAAAIILERWLATRT
jgi:putative Holliday junction resolvase